MKENLFESLSKKRGLYICLSLLVLICFFVFKDFILLRNLFIYKDVASDSVNASYAQFLNISEYLRAQGFPKWSFNNGLGQNIFALILRDPSDLLVYFVKPENIASLVIFKELLKILGAGVIFYLFLKKIALNTYSSLIGAMLFAFSGFMILGSGWYIFTFEAFAFALLLYTFERTYQDNAWYLFLIPVVLLSVSMPFNLYVYGLFLFVYIMFRYLLEKGNDVKGLFLLFFKIGGLVILGLGISSVFLFSNIKQLLESPRVAGDATFFDTLSGSPMFGVANHESLVTSIMRFFSNDILGSGLNFKGSNNYLEAPLFYCGLFTLLLIPQAFVFFTKRQKIAYSIFVAIWLLPVLFPFFRYAFWLFTGDYYRAFSLCVDVCLLLIGLQALNQIDKSEKINVTVLGVTLGVLLALLYYPYSGFDEIIDKSVRATVRNFLVVYAVLLYLRTVPKVKVYMQLAILLVVFVELTYFSYTTVNDKRSPITSKELKHKTGFNDYSKEAIAYIKSIDKGFYRIDKNYSSSPAYNGGLNDPQAQYYRGTCCYNSFNQKYYVQFLNGVDVTTPNQDKAEVASRRIAGLLNRPLLESLCGVKYFLSKRPDNGFLYATHDSLAMFGDVRVFRKKYCLPVGFAYDKYVFASDFAKLSNNQKDVMLFKSIVIKDDEQKDYKDFVRLELKDTVSEYGLDAYANDVASLKKDSVSFTVSDHNNLKGKIKLDKTKAVFFSIPYDSGWKASIDGKETAVQMVDFGLIGVMVHAGEHSVELTYQVPYLYSGSMVSLGSMLLFIGIFIGTRKRQKILNTSSEKLA